MHLLTTKNAKTDKSAAYGYLSAILQLQPAAKIAGLKTCPWAGDCAKTCLQHCGRNRLAGDTARRYRTEMLAMRPEVFLTLLRADIYAHIRKAEREGLTPTLRLNGLSDIDWAAKFPELFEEFNALQFIDYTKELERLFRPQPKNYHLTYSANEKTPPGGIARVYKETPYNVAMVFLPDKPLKTTIDGKSFGVFDGDQSDLRHLDPRKIGRAPAIVGLRYKEAYSPKTGKRADASQSRFVIFT